MGDDRLHNLQDKSHVLQGTSGAFSRQAKRLRWEMRFQQYRLFLLVSVLVVWASCFFVFRHHLKAYASISTVCIVLIYLAQRYLQKRWRSQLGSEDQASQLLDPPGHGEAM